MRTLFLTGSGSLGACAKRTSIADDSSAMVVFMRRLRMHNVAGRCTHEAHPRNISSTGKRNDYCCGNVSSLGCFVPVVLFSHQAERKDMCVFALLEVVVRSLIACASCLSHNLPASIAKILNHCVAAMFSGMLRLHLCDVAVASHRARVMFVNAHAHAHRHEQCAMAFDQRTKRRWNIDASHQTHMDCKFVRFFPVDLRVGAGDVVCLGCLFSLSSACGCFQ